MLGYKQTGSSTLGAHTENNVTVSAPTRASTRTCLTPRNTRQSATFEGYKSTWQKRNQDAHTGEIKKDDQGPKTAVAARRLHQRPSTTSPRKKEQKQLKRPIRPGTRGTGEGRHHAYSVAGNLADVCSACSLPPLPVDAIQSQRIPIQLLCLRPS